MSTPQPPVYPDEPKIPVLPNLLTAGNLLCGFFSILTIFEGMKFPSGTEEAFVHYQHATYLIFAACIFDLLDGRVARMCKSDGPFGREFDSIADVVSFGIAPAMLLAQAVLFNLDVPYLGWAIAVLYLLWVIFEKLAFGIDIPGYATIIVLILALGAMELICIGIIGEYVGRTFEQSKQRPVYLAKEILSYEDQ